MATHSSPPKQLTGVDDRGNLLIDALQGAQSKTIRAELPTLAVANGLWVLVCSIAIGRRETLFFVAASLMLASSLVAYRSLNFPLLSVAIAWCRTCAIALYAGLLSIAWSVIIVFHLSQLPPNAFIILMTGCLLLMFWAASTLYPIPIACAAYIAPVSLSGIYVSFFYFKEIQILFILLIFFVTCSSIWIVLQNLKNFLRHVELNFERASFLRKAEIAIASQNQFLENVSHEIKTPLTVVMGYAKILSTMKMKIPEIHGETLNHLELSTIKLSKTIDVLLDFSKLNAGKLELKEKVFDIRSLLEKSVASMQEATNKKKIELKLNFDPDIPEAFMGDAERIDQIIFNLIENAIKFTQNGFIRVDIGCDYPEAHLGQEKMLRISVSDTGIGIDASRHAFIFHGFYQVDGSVTRRHGGMGLGLAVSKMLANMMNGDLRLDTSRNVGCTFECWLPMKDVIQNLPEAALPSFFIKSNQESFRILVVDDDFYIRHYLQILLSSAGWTVELCDDGISAISKCLEQSYDLILMDIQMPMMTGIDASMIICSNPLNRDTPIIAMTGYLSTDRIAEMQSAGLTNYLGKPFVPDELLSTARQAVLTAKMKIAAHSSFRQ